MTRRLLAVIVALATLLVLPSSALADSNCDPPRNGDGINRQGGWTEAAFGTGNRITALAASFEGLSTHADWGAGNTGTFIRLSEKGKPYNFISAGLYNNWPVQRHGFVELGSLFGVTQWSFTPPPVDSWVDLQISQQANGTWRIYKDSQLYLTIPDQGWTAGVAQVFNESHSASNQWWGGTWDYGDINLIRYAINGAGSYINFGSSSYTTETFPHKVGTPWLSDYEIWRTMSGYQGYPEMDTFDWDCH